MPVAAPASTSATIRALLAAPLTVDAAVRITLINNPQIQALFDRLGVAPDEATRMAALSDPGAAVAEAARNRRARFDAMHGRPQGRQPSGNDAAANAATTQLVQTALGLIFDARAAFFAVRVDEAALALRDEVLDAAVLAAEVAQRLRQAGNITSIELQLQQRATEQARLDLIVAEERAVQSRLRLNALMGLLGDAGEWSVAPDWPERPADEPVALLERRALERRIDLQAARLDLEATLNTRGLGRALQWRPAGAGDAAALLLPEIDWTAGIAENDEAPLREKQRRYLSLLVEIRSQVRGAATAVSAAGRRAEIIATAIVPLQASILEEGQRRYNAMALGPVQLLQLKQAELDARRQASEAQRDYWLARAHLDQIVGHAPGFAAEAAPTPTPLATP